MATTLTSPAPSSPSSDDTVVLNMDVDGATIAVSSSTADDATTVSRKTDVTPKTNAKKRKREMTAESLPTYASAAAAVATSNDIAGNSGTNDIDDDDDDELVQHIQSRYREMQLRQQKEALYVTAAQNTLDDIKTEYHAMQVQMSTLTSEINGAGFEERYIQHVQHVLADDMARVVKKKHALILRQQHFTAEISRLTLMRKHIESSLANRPSLDMPSLPKPAGGDSSLDVLPSTPSKAKKTATIPVTPHPATSVPKTAPGAPTKKQRVVILPNQDLSKHKSRPAPDIAQELGKQPNGDALARINGIA